MSFSLPLYCRKTFLERLTCWVNLLLFAQSFLSIHRSIGYYRAEISIMILCTHTTTTISTLYTYYLFICISITNIETFYACTQRYVETKVLVRCRYHFLQYGFDFEAECPK